MIQSNEARGALYTGQGVKRQVTPGQASAQSRVGTSGDQRVLGLGLAYTVPLGSRCFNAVQ